MAGIDIRRRGGADSGPSLPTTDADRLIVRASDMHLTVGSASATNYGGIPVWALDAASNEGVGLLVYPFPSHWATFDLDIWWLNSGTGSGDVRWRVFYGSVGNGDAASLTAGNTETVAAAPTVANQVKVTEGLTGIAVPAAGKALQLRLQREASHASDTLAADAGLALIVLRNAATT